MIVEVQVRSVYGRNRIYPMNETAAALCFLIKRKTFEKEDLSILEGIGFKIKWIPHELPLPNAE